MTPDISNSLKKLLDAARNKRSLAFSQILKINQLHHQELGIVMTLNTNGATLKYPFITSETCQAQEDCCEGMFSDEGYSLDEFDGKTKITKIYPNNIFKKFFINYLTTAILIIVCEDF